MIKYWWPPFVSYSGFDRLEAIASHNIRCEWTDGDVGYTRIDYYFPFSSVNFIIAVRFSDDSMTKMEMATEKWFIIIF